MFRFHFGGLHVTCGFPSQSNHQKGGTDRSGVTSLRPMAKWPMVDTPETMGATMINRRFLFLPFCRAGDMCGFFCGLPHYPVFFFQRLHPLLNPGSGGLEFTKLVFADISVTITSKVSHIFQPQVVVFFCVTWVLDQSHQ